MDNNQHPSDNERMIDLCITENEAHELQITSALDAAEIDYSVLSFYDHAYDGVLQLTHGHSKIMVLEHEYDKASEILNSLQQS